MSKATALTYAFLKKFPKEEVARRSTSRSAGKASPFVRIVGVLISNISSEEVAKRAIFLCWHCTNVYTIRMGTIFQRSHVPLHKWLAICLVMVWRTPMELKAYGPF